MDSNLLQRMSARKYLSMTLERTHDLPADPGLFLQSNSRTSFNFSQEIAMGPEAFGFLLDYVTQPDDARKSVEACSSAFEAGMPGVTPLKEVKEVDLGRWKLKLGTVEATLQVRSQGTHPHASDVADDPARWLGPCSLGNGRHSRSGHGQRPGSGAGSLHRAGLGQANGA